MFLLLGYEFMIILKTKTAVKVSNLSQNIVYGYISGSDNFLYDFQFWKYPLMQQNTVIRHKNSSRTPKRRRFVLIAYIINLSIS